MEKFCASYNLKNLIKQPTCFKNLKNPTCIDHILTNHPKSFHSPSVFETGLSDFHKLTLTILKVFHAKYKPKIIQYRDFNHVDNAAFRTDLPQELPIKPIFIYIFIVLFIFYHEHYRFKKESFIKPCLFHWSYKPWGYIPSAP